MCRSSMRSTADFFRKFRRMWETTGERYDGCPLSGMEKSRLFIWLSWELSDHTRSMEWQHSTVTSSKKRSSVIFMRSTLSALQTKQTELPPVDGSVSVTGNWLI